jgi:3-phenylpropionate/trans-cinnamate dioxygenase ferredoxin reductase component
MASSVPLGEHPVVLVGGGLAGAKAAEELRAQGYAGPVVLVGDEPGLPYERPPLSKGYLQRQSAREETSVHPAQWYAENDVDLRSGTTVACVEPGAHRVLLDDGEPVPYSRLLLATGSEPRRLPVPGADLDGVLTLRRLPDSDRLREHLAGGRPLVVVGGGWIGLEVAAAARLADVPVTVLEAGEAPLGGVLGAEMAAVFADLHRAHGVDLRTGVSVTEVVGRADRAAGVRLADGTQVEGDAVLVAVGARPLVDLAVGAGLAVDDGVVVDAHLRTSDPDVYAAGDIAEADHPGLGRRIRVEHWAAALHQPAVAVAGMLGEPALYDRVPYFFTDQYDLGMEYRGHAGPGGYDEVVVRGSVDDLAFTAFWVAGGHVVAAMNVNMWDDGDALEALVGARAAVDSARLADPATDLEDLAAAD